MISSRPITICEVSTRDGFQTLPPPSIPDKLKLLELIADCGIRCIEVGSFVGDNQEFWQMHSTPEVFNKMTRRPDVVYRALLQSPYGMREAVEAGCNHIKLNISGSEEHYYKMTGKSIAQGMEGFREIGSLAAQHHVAILGSISLAFVSPYDGFIPTATIQDIIQRFLDCGATEISLNDTAGLAFPNQVEERFEEMKRVFPQVKSWAFHPHNTRGTALANIVAAISGGATKIDSSLAGIGGCPVFKNASGNISTEDAVYMLNGMGMQTGVDLDKAIVAGEFVEQLVEHKNIDSYLQRLEKIKKESGNADI
jgi:hydroxymethylglutaryl-CoA lyase